MTMNRVLRQELLAVTPPSSRAARAEAVALLRFGGGVRVLSGKVILEATLETPGGARRLAALLHNQYGATSQLVGFAATARTVRVHGDAQLLAHSVGLINRRGAPVVGMPPEVVTGAAIAADVAAAALRGAVLAAGGIGVNRAGTVTLFVRSPGLAAAMAVGGFARKLDATCAVRDKLSGQGHADFTLIRDYDGLYSLLRSVGAPRFADQFVNPDAEKRGRIRTDALRDLNHLRAAAAGHATAVRVRQALTVLGTDVPACMAGTAALRIAYPNATMAELGRRSDPPVSKNTIAGRLRRLVLAADRLTEAETVSA